MGDCHQEDKGQSNDLPAVGRIGQNFLITRHGGIEDDLANCLTFRADRTAVEYRAIL